MGVHVVKRACELGDDLVLAPERFDPRRRADRSSGKTLAELAEILGENTSVRSFDPERPVLVLNTTHAYEGFVILRHAPTSPERIGSPKRRLLPGDVIVSRLRPYLRQIAFIDEALFHKVPGGNDVCASAEFFVLRGRRGFDAVALIPFLLSEPIQAVLAAGQEGGHHPRFSRELLASLRIPAFVLENAIDYARKVRELAAGVRQSLSGCQALVAELQERMAEDP
ncbi:MAG: hypothetical protein RMJ98_01490 [Myxococcales bacterium]|nr:hypothetical protein [Polyangiaceae bacterium]MDW8247960.1 hypothetical protein [Myxococcales bacterium]